MTTLDLEETYRQHIRQARERQVRGIQDYATTIAAFYHKLIEEGLPDESASIISSYLVEVGRERVEGDVKNGDRPGRKSTEWERVSYDHDSSQGYFVVTCDDCGATVNLAAFGLGPAPNLAATCNCPHAYRLIVHPDGDTEVFRLDLTR